LAKPFRFRSTILGIPFLQKSKADPHQGKTAEHDLQEINRVFLLQATGKLNIDQDLGLQTDAQLHEGASKSYLKKPITHSRLCVGSFLCAYLKLTTTTRRNYNKTVINTTDANLEW
jgi:hypothetical protein